MGEFFKGWRRKAGLVTLAMALVLTGAWIRTYAIKDVITIPLTPSIHYVISSRAGVMWRSDFYSFSSDGEFQENLNQKGIGLEWQSADASKFPLWLTTDIEPFSLHWFLSGGGFFIGADSWWTEDQILIKRWLISYSLLVLPLTLLSAWLILVKPRKAKAATGSTP